MMKTFMGEDYLLNNDTAVYLYNEYAKNMPIIDYHCHIPVEDIAKDTAFDNITQIWLSHDHYKWRIMRIKGIDEYYITGDSSDHEKYEAWTKTMDHSIGNPVYQWCHMELKKYFGYNSELNSNTATEVWEHCNRKIKEDGLTVRKLMKMSNVEVVVTTDDPVDDLKWHEMIAADDSFDIKVYPAWRPDKLFNVEDEGFADYINKIERACGNDMKISSVDDLKSAIISRLDFFEKHGCNISDHGIDFVPYSPCDDFKADEIFKKALNGANVSFDEKLCFMTYMMLFLGKEYKKRDWIMQLHFGATRNNNSKMFSLLGPDSGFDGIHECVPISELVSYLDALDKEDMLPKTILYSLNPNDNTILDVTAGTFRNIQHGAAWWFNDNADGIREHLRGLARHGLLSGFVGMLTDSRSFVSYVRHDYFRRILCDLIGEYVENGEFPADMERLGIIVQDISYNNVKSYIFS